MRVDGIDKEVGVVILGNTNLDFIVIESKIDGDFNGWSGKTIFKLINGQIWKQKRYAYYYTYKFMPKVSIYKSFGVYRMEVEGTREIIEVERIK